MTETLHFTVGGLIEEMARRFPDNDCLVYPDRDLRYSYREFDARCDRIAKGLLKLGVKKGDHLAIWATNVPEWVVLQFATAKIGAVLVTVNTSYKSAELEYVLKQSDATTLFLVQEFKDTDYVATLNTVVPELATAVPGALQSPKLPCLKNVIFLGGDAPAGMLPYAELEALGAEVPDAELAAVKGSLDEHEVINMQYTSGTTGFPKGVMLTHHNIVNNGYNIGECMKFTEKDRLCIPVPFFHCFGCVLGVLACVTHGSTMVPVEIFNPEAVLKTIAAEKCTAVHGVPTMFIAELEHPAFHKYDLSSLRSGIMAGSPCPTEVMKRVIRDMHAAEITIAYGQTESSPVITQTRTDDPIELRVATVGRALPEVEVKIVDIETGASLPPGKQGELCTRGYLVMKGYYKMPEETARAIDPEGLAAHRRSGGDGRERLLQDHRPHQEHDHPRRREHLPAGDRGVPLYPPQGLRCPGLRRAGPQVRRAGDGGGQAQGRGCLQRGGDSRVLPRADRQFQNPRLRQVRRRVSDDRQRQDPEVQAAGDGDPRSEAGAGRRYRDGLNSGSRDPESRVQGGL